MAEKRKTKELVDGEKKKGKYNNFDDHTTAKSDI